MNRLLPLMYIPKILLEQVGKNGILLKERTAKEAERGILEAFQRTCKRDLIRQNMQKRTWESTARHVVETFQRLFSQR